MSGKLHILTSYICTCKCKVKNWVNLLYIRCNINKFTVLFVIRHDKIISLMNYFTIWQAYMSIAAPVGIICTMYIFYTLRTHMLLNTSHVEMCSILCIPFVFNMH